MVKNSSHKHLECDTLVEHIHQSVRVQWGSAISRRPDQLRLLLRWWRRWWWQERRLFVALFDSVFTEIAFTYAPCTEIKQIRKCLRHSRRPFAARRDANQPTLMTASIYPFEDTRVISCVRSYRFCAYSLFTRIFSFYA